MNEQMFYDTPAQKYISYWVSDKWQPSLKDILHAAVNKTK